jgi:hypothetical protein
MTTIGQRPSDVCGGQPDEADVTEVGQGSDPGVQLLTTTSMSTRRCRPRITPSVRQWLAPEGRLPTTSELSACVL